jgi:HEAT repeat protein
MLRPFSAILFSVLIVLPIYAQEQPKEEKVEEKIARLVNELGSDEWRVREAAERELIDLGKVVVTAVSEAVKSPDFEVRLRATKVLRNLYWLSAEDLKKVEDLVKQFLELKLESKQAEVIKSYSSIIRALRRIKNSQHYLIDSVVEEQDPKKREKLAQLLNGTEYTDPLRRVNSEAEFGEDVLLALARDGVVPAGLRCKAVKALGTLKSVRAVASLVDLLSEKAAGPDVNLEILKAGTVNLEVLKALKKIVPVDNAPNRKLPSQVSEVDKQFWTDWWEKNAKSEQYAPSAKDLEVRKKAEEEWAKEPIPFLGVGLSVVLPDSAGATIGEVQPNTAASQAGLQVGDVVVEIEGRDVTNWENLVHGIRRSKVGQKVELKVVREGKELTIEATLGARPRNQ